MSGKRSTSSRDYVLELTEAHCGILIEALDLYSRIGMGQLGEILQYAVSPLMRGTEEEQGYFYKCKDGARKVLDTIKMQLWGLDHPAAYYGITAPEISNRFRTAVDLRQVVRRFLALERKPEGGWTTDFDKPFPWSREPLALIRRIATEGELEVPLAPRAFILRGGGPHMPSYIHQGQELLEDDEEITVREVPG